jgi:phosphoglucosamine mutase
MQKLFGTDGIRGHAGEFPLDLETVGVIGSAISRCHEKRLGRPPRFIFGRDTRESGPAIEKALIAGAASEKAECESAGVITTPGVAYLASAFDFDAGIVISASHNPYHDNGIKIFGPAGKKLDEQAESEIEAAVAGPHELAATTDHVQVHRSEVFCEQYLDHLREEAGNPLLSGVNLILDCANGAASWLAPGLFDSLGASVKTINADPDGRNINHECGSTHLEQLVGRIRESASPAIGVAFDGDADRVLFVDEDGSVVDGDATLWIMAQYLTEQGQLENSTVVATVMSNIGLQIALASRGIELLRANVGDKYVLERLIETKSVIGGEQSGHIIFPRISLVGDGMMTALLLLKAIREMGVPLAKATSGFVRYPQILLNIPVREKRPFESVPEIATAADRVERELDGQGRLLLRYSGTEKLARVMIEGKDQSGIEAQAKQLADVIGTSLG